MSDVAVVTRAYDAESPYVRSFIGHYSALGCNEFHIVVPKGNSADILKEVCKDRHDVIFHVGYNGFDQLRGCQSVPLPAIQASHLLSVDVDEYLDIDDLQRAIEHDYVRFRWAIAPFPGRGMHRCASLVDGQGKYLIRTKYCEFLDDHDCRLNTRIEPKLSDINLIHHPYRSFNDLLLKCAMGQYGDYQMINNENIRNIARDIRLLPNKFKTAAIYTRLVHASDTTHRNFLSIDDDIEQCLVQRFCSNFCIDGLQLLLFQYMSRIDIPRLLDAVFHSDIYRQYGRIPHFKLATYSDATLMEQLRPAEWIAAPRRKRLFWLPLH